MLIGLGYVPDCSLPLIDYANDAPALAAFGRVQNETGRLVETLPPLYEYLAHRYKVELGETSAASKDVALATASA
jgi:hypothetical protein